MFQPPSAVGAVSMVPPLTNRRLPIRPVPAGPPGSSGGGDADSSVIGASDVLRSEGGAYPTRHQLRSPRTWRSGQYHLEGADGTAAPQLQ